MGGMGGRPPGGMGMGGMGMGGMRPPVRRGGSPLGSLIGLVAIAIIVLASLISSLDPIVWIAVAVVAVVGIGLFYKYKSDRAKAEETQRILDTDLGKAGSSVSDLEDKYK